MTANVRAKISSLFLFLFIFGLQSGHSISFSDSIPVFPDLVYEYRITELNNLTPIELDYNEYVRRYIDVYTIEKRQHLEEIAGRAQRYFPMIEEKLDQYDLPHELKYLAVIESALDPFAVSSSGAVGLWQFKLHTSRMFDLEVNSYIDERRDPYKSTDAACRYFKYLYQTYGDWQLVLASYNSGPGEVRKAIDRAGEGKSFWELYEHMPAQTKGYVPAFIAVNYAMNHMEDHLMKPDSIDYEFFDTDTLRLTYETSFDRISQAIEVKLSTLKMLNPAYRKGVIPQMEESATLVLPKEKISAYLKNEKKVSSSRPSVHNLRNEDSVSSNDNKTKIVHTVTKGEYFHKIAINYGCTMDEIMKWNDLDDNNLEVGQKLDIWVDPSYIERVRENNMKMRRRSEADTNKRVVYYTVQSGDTIWSIANKFNCESIADLIEVNDIQDENDIKPGKKIKIYLEH
ncbi:MAG: transglycosylase SLT domain-containing protein [Bacteroidales bacterium]